MIDFADTAAIAGYGRDALDHRLLDEIAECLADSPLGDVVAALDALDRALLANPVQAKRRTGFFGRLLGKDIEAQAIGAQLQERMGVLLDHAQREMGELEAFVARLAAVQARLVAATDTLDARIREGRALLAARSAPGDPNAPEVHLQRRLVQLDTIAASWRITQQQVQLTIDHCGALVRRHDALVDVLRPVWRQHRIATRSD